MKEIEIRLLYELMKNSRRSDRDLAKAVGVSQPTVSRAIKKMQKELDLLFTTSADLGKAGFELIVVTFGRKQEALPPVKIQEFLDEYRDCIVFASTGTSSGMDADRMVISVHKSYSDYTKFRDYLKTAWRGLILVGESFIIGLKSDRIIRPLSTHYLFEDHKK